MTEPLAGQRGRIIRVIGVDFDNTLVGYDEVLYRVARQRGLIVAQAPRSKLAIREVIRESPGGDRAWHAVQTEVYGQCMDEARLIDGVPRFLERCRAHRTKVFIISHKTEVAVSEERTVCLREVAAAWMSGHRFFDPDGLAFAPSDVYFESTRSEKVTRIAQLGCTHFVDDLEETFLDASFPEGVQKILYAPNGRTAVVLPDVQVCSNWKEISDYCFSANR